ncbi:hypothetical protein AMTR_s00084p00037950, partial [Amborella trichopoda]
EEVGKPSKQTRFKKQHHADLSLVALDTKNSLVAQKSHWWLTDLSGRTSGGSHKFSGGTRSSGGPHRSRWRLLRSRWWPSQNLLLADVSGCSQISLLAGGPHRSRWWLRC